MARQRPVEYQPTELNQVVHEVLDLLAYPLRVDDVEVRLDLLDDLPVLRADPHQLHQVLVNLATNAHQAMRQVPGPRRLVVATRHGATRARVSLEVRDSGPGIPAEVRERIFEPFFTTKPPGQGTGLGLSLCLGIVEAHGGVIHVESEPGQGAVFRVELPVEPAAAEAAATPAADLPPVRGKAVLVVDDEPEVAALLADVLAEDEHRVDTAASGVAALALLAEQRYDVILSDLRMPELDGPGLYREVGRRWPELARRFVFLTGDTLSPDAARFLEETPVLSVSKPFGPGDIRRVLRKVLPEP
jgi:two-component system NtrC family sensor kinase